jgi:hypothetical protein
MLVALWLAHGCRQDVEPVVTQTIALQALPATLDFGRVPVVAAVQDSIVVVNAGNAAWNTYTPPEITGAGFSFVSGCDAPLAPDTTCTLRVAFVPEALGPTTGTVRFAVQDDVADGNDVVVPLTGDGIPTEVFVSPAHLDFGNVIVGSSATRTVHIENRGSSTVRFDVALSGPFVDSAGAHSFSSALAGSTSVDVPLIFAPTTSGRASGTLQVITCGPACGPRVELIGQSVSPRIEVQPRQLDLGVVAPGDSVDGVIEVKNTGDDALVVGAVELVGAPGFSWAEQLMPLVLGPDETRELAVSFAPTQGAATAAAVFTLYSNDPLSPRVFVPITASAPGPGLVVVPEVAHLGFLDPEETRDLSVVARSVGDVAVLLDDVRLVGGGDAFSLVGAPVGLSLGRGEAAQFFVRGKATSGAVTAGGATTQLLVVAESVSLVNITFSAGTTGCVPRALAPHVDLGAVRLGEQSSGSVLIENVGDATCTLADLRSGADVGLPEASDMNAAGRGLETLSPGAAGFVEFSFAPFVQHTSTFTALATFIDVASPVWVSASGRGVRGGLVAVPTAIELGPVAHGCPSPSGTVLFVADGAETIRIERFALGPLESPVRIVAPPTPLVLLPGESGAVHIEGSAQVAPGVYEAAVDAVSDLGTASARITLTVVEDDDDIEEHFVATDIEAVDILFVVDNSGSMGDDQDLLASNFASFFATALADRSTDFQVGVTTTDVLSPGAAMGGLVGPVLNRFTPDLEDKFAEQVLVGEAGTGLELGLEAMRMALEDRAGDGLIRSDAALSVVFVSDEEDAGAFPEALPDPALARDPLEYVALLQAKKGGALAHTPVLVSAVIVPGFARRYQTLVDAFGGVALDITSTGWGTRLGEIGIDTFSLARAYVLANEPDVNSLVVLVNGRAVTAFSYEERRRAVVLDEAPPPGADVVIRYRQVCP